MALAVTVPTKKPKEAVDARRRAAILVLSTAELAPCTCPDACERDHDRD